MKGYDYSQPGAYFVTICTHESECTLGKVVGDEVVLSPLGQTVMQIWRDTPQHFPCVELDAFVVMPSHVHGIIVIKYDEGQGAAGRAPMDAPREGLCLGTAGRAPTEGACTREFGAPVAGSVPAIVGAFKTAVTRHARRRGWPRLRPVWQRSYYEHVIKDQDEWALIAQYIADNPSEWDLERESDAQIARRKAALHRWSGE